MKVVSKLTEQQRSKEGKAGCAIRLIGTIHSPAKPGTASSRTALKKRFAKHRLTLTLMVLPNLFTRASAKKKKEQPNTSNDKEDLAGNHHTFDSPPPSPTKKSPTKSTRDRDSSRPVSPRSSSSRTYSKASNSPRYTYDRSSHPLNLPPHELRRLSALSAMSDPSTPMEMDQDEEGPASSLPSSPPPAMSPGPVSGANGVNGVNGLNDDDSPIPPPHKVPTSPPPQPQPPPPPPPKPTVDAEACKAAGNKFFKAKDYAKAIKEYSKGGNNSPHHECLFTAPFEAQMANTSYNRKLSKRIHNHLPIFQIARPP